MPAATLIPRMSSDQFSAAEMLDALLEAKADERARILARTENPAGALAKLIDRADGMILTDAGKASEMTGMLVDLADRAGSASLQAHARWARARALSYSGRFAEALAACEEGRRIAESAGETVGAARLRMVSMHALGELGRLDEAIAAGEAARAAFLAAGEQALAARADLNIGTAHQRADNPVKALQCFDRARPVLADQPMMLGALDNNRGEALLAVNDFAGAEQAFTQALTTLQSARADLGAAIAESNLADLAARQGRLQKAMRHFEQARRILERGVSPAHLARLIAEQADAMSLLGLPREALIEYQRALAELDRQGQALEGARARGGLGMTLLRLGRLAEADAALAQAASAFDELGHATARARVDLARAELAARRQHIDEAEALVRRAIAEFDDRPADAAAARMLLAHLLMHAERRDEAEDEASMALDLATRLGLVPLQADALSLRGRMRGQSAEFDQAIADLQAAVALVERVRGTLAAQRFRAAFFGDRAAMYEGLVDALLNRAGTADVAQAFAVIEQARSRSLLDQMQETLDGAAPDVEAANDAESALLRRLEQARAQLNALYSVVHDERRGAGGDRANWREKVRACAREVEDIESRLATTSRMGALFARTVSADEAQQLLGGDQAVIEYFAIGEELAAFVLRRDALSVHRRLGSVGEAGSMLAALQFQINRALRPGAMDGPRGERLVADAQRELARLGEMLLSPLASELEHARQLVIMPHGILHAAPFAALRINEQHLLESHLISYAPSVTLLKHLQMRGGDPRDILKSPMVVGVADEQAPQIEAEARCVQGLLKCAPKAMFFNEQATVARVSSVMSDASLLHLACHGRHLADLPASSGLRLADRWLTVRDMLAMHLTAELVVLSGCDTALSRVSAGDEIMGLSRGLFAAGAASIVASLWRVDDGTTSEFFETFYDRLRNLDRSDAWSKARALHEAQLATMARQPHPAFWAPFVLTGQP